jgi:biotin carboxyl carrier protein
MSQDFTLALDGVSQPFVVGFDADSGQVLVDGTLYDVAVDAGADQAVVGGIVYSLTVEGLEDDRTGPRAGPAVAAKEGAVTAIMPGKIIQIMVSEGDDVEENDVICILEAMKMENELKAPKGGIVTKLYMQAGQDVQTGTVLAEIE